jgi:prepilin-type N-terminal cleavage/methylation domain-containing protein
MKNRGFSLIEVMMALVILGIALEIFFRTTSMAQKNNAAGRDWQLETTVVERTIERLRIDSTVTALQNMNLSWIDSSMGQKVQLIAVGSVASNNVAPDFPADMVAQVSIKAIRIGMTDTTAVTAVIWSNQ